MEEISADSVATVTSSARGCARKQAETETADSVSLKIV